MGLFWAILVSIILALIIYGIIRSNITDAKRRKQKEKFVQRTDAAIREGGRYDFHLTHGKVLPAMEFLGPLPPETAAEGYGWGDMLVLKDGEGKKVFIQRSAIRMMAET